MHYVLRVTYIRRYLNAGLPHILAVVEFLTELSFPLLYPCKNIQKMRKTGKGKNMKGCIPQIERRPQKIMFSKYDFDAYFRLSKV